MPEILAEIAKGNIQLPEFQRGWVWDVPLAHRVRGQFQALGNGVIGFAIGAVNDTRARLLSAAGIDRLRAKD